MVPIGINYVHSVCGCILQTVFDSVSFDILALLMTFKEQGRLVKQRIWA